MRFYRISTIGTLKTIKSFAYEETVFHPIFNSVLVCYNCKRQEAKGKNSMAEGCADAQRRHCAQWISAHGHSFYAEMCSFQRDRRRKRCEI